MSIEDRFYAAVNVISGLPKHGPYQPSNEMKLSFYAYYKQATEGPNGETKPWSWEVAKKAKWDAWKRLGVMTREEAMAKYVDELNKIVETMSYTENVADFLKSMDEFSTIESDKDAPATSDAAFENQSINLSTSPSLEKVSTDKFVTNRDDSIDDEEEEFYTDSVESHKNVESVPAIVANGCYDQQNCLEQESTIDILMRTVLTLRTELNEITSSVRKIEQKHKALSRRNGFFKGLSSQTITFIIMWPVFANLILFWLYLRKHQNLSSFHR